MTNQEKFIEVMNVTFNAGFTKENMRKHCSPCGALKVPSYCKRFSCEGCHEWWNKEYSAAQSPNDPLTLEELREMDGEPVYTDGVYYILDCLEDDIGTNRTLIHMTDGTAFEWSVSKGMYPIIYRRKPEEGTL